jgi:hypothetical protein
MSKSPLFWGAERLLFLLVFKKSYGIIDLGLNFFGAKARKRKKLSHKNLFDDFVVFSFFLSFLRGKFGLAD